MESNRYFVISSYSPYHHNVEFFIPREGTDGLNFWKNREEKWETWRGIGWTTSDDERSDEKRPAIFTWPLDLASARLPPASPPSRGGSPSSWWRNTSFIRLRHLVGLPGFNYPKQVAEGDDSPTLLPANWTRKGSQDEMKVRGRIDRRRGRRGGGGGRRWIFSRIYPDRRNVETRPINYSADTRSFFTPECKVGKRIPV